MPSFADDSPNPNLKQYFLNLNHWIHGIEFRIKLVPTFITVKLALMHNKERDEFYILSFNEETDINTHSLNKEFVKWIASNVIIDISSLIKQ